MPENLAATMAAVARTIGNAQTAPEALRAIVEAARSSLPGFDHIGISTIPHRGQITTDAATTDLVLELDRIQYDLRQGPCVEALSTTRVVTAPDIAHEHRWPDYVAAAREKGLRAQFAVRLYLDDEGTIGGLNIYSTDTPQVTAENVAVAEIFATHAVLTLGKVRQLDQLRDAMQTRQHIGEAVGLLMADYQLDPTAAFAFLARVSQQRNVKARDIAAQMVQQHIRNIDRDGGTPAPS